MAKKTYHKERNGGLFPLPKIRQYGLTASRIELTKRVFTYDCTEKARSHRIAKNVTILDERSP